jgi:hypothetical protein
VGCIVLKSKDRISHWLDASAVRPVKPALLIAAGLHLPEEVGRMARKSVWLLLGSPTDAFARCSL